MRLPQIGIGSVVCWVLRIRVFALCGILAGFSFVLDYGRDYFDLWLCGMSYCSEYCFVGLSFGVCVACV